MNFVIVLLHDSKHTANTRKDFIRGNKCKTDLVNDQTVTISSIHFTVYATKPERAPQKKESNSLVTSLGHGLDAVIASSTNASKYFIVFILGLSVSVHLLA